MKKYVTKSSVGRFVEEMNSYARLMGLYSLHFVDPCGLNENNVGSAKDVLSLTLSAKERNEIAENWNLEVSQIKICNIFRWLKNPIKKTFCRVISMSNTYPHYLLPEYVSGHKSGTNDAIYNLTAVFARGGALQFWGKNQKCALQIS